MRDSVKDFIKICKESLDIRGPIYEFGSRWIHPQGNYADLRPLFPDIEYIGCDIKKGDGVDLILDISVASEVFEYQYSGVARTIIMADTLEHIMYPHLAFENCYRMLKKDGILIVTTVLDFGIHSPPDYWRFTPEGLTLLFRDNYFVYRVGAAGRKDFPHTVVGVGSKGVNFDITDEMNNWEQRWTPVKGG